ncbi:MAG: DUF1540 domain-containing protein [Intestinimonas sp.]|jgi:hypothetical protein|nr:DUF1540 domain-containing protein [Intestinimonas sp.]
MMNEKVNPSISCSVSNCKHHNKGQNHCCLNEISVGSCRGTNATGREATECASFEQGNNQ